MINVDKNAVFQHSHLFSDGRVSRWLKNNLNVSYTPLLTKNTQMWCKSARCLSGSRNLTLGLPLLAPTGTAEGTSPEEQGLYIQHSSGSCPAPILKDRPGSRSPEGFQIFTSNLKNRKFLLREKLHMVVVWDKSRTIAKQHLNDFFYCLTVKFPFMSLSHSCHFQGKWHECIILMLLMLMSMLLMWMLSCISEIKANADVIPSWEAVCL